MKRLLPVLLIMLVCSCRETWTRADKGAFYEACTDEANKWAGSPEQAKTYCDCVFEKMSRKYPHEDDALAHIDSLAKDPDLISCKDGIMKSATP